MNCPLLSEESAGLLLDYSEGRIETGRSTKLEPDEFDRHVEHCERCAALLADQSAMWTALDAWEPPAVSLDFNRRLLRRLDAENSAPWYRRLVHSLRAGAWKPAFPLAAAAVVIAAGFMMDHRGAMMAPSRTAANGVSLSEADQLERTLDDIQLLHQFDSVAAAEPTGSKPVSEPM